MALASGILRYDTPVRDEVSPTKELLATLDKGLEVENRSLKLRARFSNESAVTEDEARTVNRMLAAVKNILNTPDRLQKHTLTIGRSSDFIGSNVRAKWDELGDAEVIFTRSPHHYATQFELEATPSSKGSYFSETPSRLKDPDKKLIPLQYVTIDATKGGYLTLPLTANNTVTVKFEGLQG